MALGLAPRDLFVHSVAHLDATWSWPATACAVACRWLLAAVGCDDVMGNNWGLGVRHTIDGWQGVHLRCEGVGVAG